jgi:hypothetical protein
MDSVYPNMYSHLKHTLCQEILANVSSNATIEANISAVKEAFARTEEQLKQHLIALPASKRIAKGICNTGSCAAIALLINSTLIVANVGDCAIVMGKKKSMEDTAGTCNSSCTSSSSQSTSPSSSQEEKLQAIVLTQTHNCENEEEAQAGK